MRVRPAVELLQRVAGFERRALELYRHFARAFEGHQSAARTWQAMAEAEAGHFAILSLAEDRLPAGEGTAGCATVLDEAQLARWEATLADLEAKGRQPAITLEEAAEITVTWEREEAPRLLALLDALPEPTRRSTAAGLAQGADEHLECLERLLETVGREALLPALAPIRDSVSRLNALAAG
jgi:rubrerythrin